MGWAMAEPSSKRVRLEAIAAAEQADVRPRDLRPAPLVTELDENVMTARTSAKALANVAPMAQEAARYLFSNDAGPRTMVKPGPDPARPQETTWFTEEGLHEECYRPSTNWTQAGQRAKGRSLGKVYLEVLECRGLPNVDAGTHHVCTRAICRCSEATHLSFFSDTGGAIGNKTDAFVSVVYGDIMVQTEVN